MWIKRYISGASVILYLKLSYIINNSTAVIENMHKQYARY